MADITVLLNDLAAGRTSSQEELWRVLYQELRSMAAGMLANERPGQTLQPTALIHEAYLRLLGSDPNLYANRRYFFGAAAQAMRRILVDTARRKQSIKAGGELEQVPWEEPSWTAKLPPSEVLAIHEALERLQLDDATAAEVVNLHFFAGFSLEETADVLGIARATAYRSWTYARAWLRTALDDGK
ncbi:MAG TPA: ECF-type sigma factor [Gemmatales bacterium]|nr:ECF-type sigma factor [Gemmatales bacterium]